MIKCLAIYPHNITKEYIEKIDKTLELAYQHNYQEVFTTIHLPEYSLMEQVECLKIISNKRKNYNLELTVDIGGKYIDDILCNKKIIDELIDVKIDFLRLDYGYKYEQIKTLYKSLKLKGFVLNASIYNEDEFKENIDKLYDIDNNILIRACHNYYIKENSGLDEIYASKQDSYISKYNIPIYYCIPTYSNPRGPLYRGLCTIENHRNKPLEYIISDLVLNHNLSAYMMADEWLNEEEFIKIESIFKELNKKLSKVETIEVRFFDGINDNEREIVLRNHIFRKDSPFNYLRSRSSREMAEFAQDIEQNNCIDIKMGYITINNLLSKRYSGELEISMIDKKAISNTNVVAKVLNKYDLIKLWRFKEDIIYRFVEK